MTKENDLSVGRQYQLAGIVVARSHRGPEPSHSERERALDELRSFPALDLRVLQMISRLAPFREHREWAEGLLPKAPAPAMASAGGRG